MAGFEPESSAFGSDHSANCTTTTTPRRNCCSKVMEDWRKSWLSRPIIEIVSVCYLCTLAQTELLSQYHKWPYDITPNLLSNESSNWIWTNHSAVNLFIRLDPGKRLYLTASTIELHGFRFFSAWRMIKVCRARGRTSGRTLFLLVCTVQLA